MIVTFNELYDKKEDLTKYNLSTPFETAALVANILCSYRKENKNNFFEMLQYLMGDIQPVSNLLKQQIDDRMSQNEKWKFIGKSYFKGASVENNYTPNDNPYEIEVKENPYSYDNDGYARLFLKSAGADSERPITLRKTKEEKWLLWSDSILGLLSDIRPCASDNPWS